MLGCGNFLKLCYYTRKGRKIYFKIFFMEETQQNQQFQAPKKLEEGSANIIAILCYFGILVVIPAIVAKEDPFVKFHVKQGLVLLIVGIILSVVSVVPVIGWIIGFIGWIACVILAIIGIINVAQGEKKKLPIIGGYGDKFNF